MYRRIHLRKITVPVCLISMILLSVLFFTAGCSDQKVSDASGYLYYLNDQETALVRREYDLPDTSVKNQVTDVSQAIRRGKAGKHSSDQPVLPDNVSMRAEYMQHQVYVYLSRNYSSISPETEILSRAAIAGSILQIKDVSGVSFFVDGKPLQDTYGSDVGIMTRKSFLSMLSNGTENPENREITLYFTDKSGNHLYREDRKVRLDGTDTLEDIVLKQLIAGPKHAGLYRTIPRKTELNNVYVMNGTCYVNFNNGIQKAESNVRDRVVIYSIVNTLTEIPEIKSVQIAINGRSESYYTMSLAKNYVRNSDLIHSDTGS